VRFDFNVGYHPNENWTISVGGRNLLENSSREFTDTMDGIVASEIPRIIYTTVAYNF
jgi:outer membrane receptor protein involved in Fe transport